MEDIDRDRDEINEKRYLSVWYHHICGPYSHSLYQIPMPTLINLSSIDPNLPIRKHHLNPSLLFRTSQYSKLMACVEFKGKLYFLGGSNQMGDWCDESSKWLEYSNDVYVYDPANARNEDAVTRAKNLPKVAPMTTGKPKPITFIHDEKIYVISGGPNWYYSRMKYFNAFECYDPSHDIWTPLPNPPPPSPIKLRIIATAVANNMLYMLTMENELHCFHLGRGTWSSPKYFTNDRIEVFSREALFVDNNLYATLGSSIAAFGPMPSSDDDPINFSFFHYYSLLDKADWGSLPSGYAKCKPSFSLAHYGGGRLCYVCTGDAPHSYIHNLSVTIFKPADLPPQNREDPTKCRITLFNSELLLTGHFSYNIYDTVTFLSTSFFSPHWFGNRDADRDIEFWYKEAEEDDSEPPTEEALETAANLEIKAMRAALSEDFEVAVDLYSQAIKLDPKNANPYLHRAQANMKLMKFSDAVDDSSKAIELDLSLSKAYLLKAVASMKIGDYDTAITALETGASQTEGDLSFTNLIEECEHHIEMGTGMLPEGTKKRKPDDVYLCS